ncbi:hypothetical protein KR018_006427 [Drosophila ironensis]|nr:hypothetical protein KR018_006427 [Drosophila ironensis]
MMMNSTSTFTSPRIEHLTAKGAKGEGLASGASAEAATVTSTPTPVPAPASALAAGQAAAKRRRLPRRRYPAEYLSRGSVLPQHKPPLDRKHSQIQPTSLRRIQHTHYQTK